MQLPRGNPLWGAARACARVPLLRRLVLGFLKSGFVRAGAAIGSSFVIRNLVIMSALTGLTAAITEFCWKGYMRQYFSSSQQYSTFMASAASICGGATIVVMVFGSFLFKYMGWTKAAQITPLCYRVIGALFLGCCVVFELGKKSVTPWLGSWVAANFNTILCKLREGLLSLGREGAV